jgi:hypothetical protein
MRRQGGACRRGSVLLLVVVAMSAMVAQVGVTEGVAATATGIGMVGPGQTAFTFVGRIEQNGTLADDVGYLTSIDGLDEGSLFSGGDPLARNESTARFTYFATATLETRSIEGNLFITSGTARTTLYFDATGGATFDTPASFKRGTAIANYESRWQDIVNVQAPNQGIATVVSDEAQISAAPFTLKGTEYAMGRRGISLHLSFSGQGTRTDPTLPRATILYGGAATALSSTGRVGATGLASGATTSGWTWVALALAALALLVSVVRAGRRGGA